jgi:hypothetical protein
MFEEVWFAWGAENHEIEVPKKKCRNGWQLKTRVKRASDRLEALFAKHQELEENMDEIKNISFYVPYQLTHSSRFLSILTKISFLIFDS